MLILANFPTTHPLTHRYTHTVHMALVGYFIVFSFVTKPGQTLEFLLWGTIVPLNFLEGYYCSIVASTPQPMAYAFTPSRHIQAFRVRTIPGGLNPVPKTHFPVNIKIINFIESTCRDPSITIFFYKL